MRTQKIIISALLILLFFGFRFATAMDRWSALSMIESGDNDAAIGPAGELSRFQIKPVLWENLCPQQPAARTDPETARHVAQAIMHERCGKFEAQFHRPPTDFEFYVLWNAPAQIQRPGKAVAERANRYCNLVGDR